MLRIWTAPESGHRADHPVRRRLRYVLSFHGIIDLLAILPFFLQTLLPGLDLRILRVVRILRILKLSHYSSALEDLMAAIWAERDSFISALYLLALTILITSCLIHYAEHDVQPDKFGSIAESMWWSLITITTVGAPPPGGTITINKTLTAGGAITVTAAQALTTNASITSTAGSVALTSGNGNVLTVNDDVTATVGPLTLTGVPALPSAPLRNPPLPSPCLR